MHFEGQPETIVRSLRQLRRSAVVACWVIAFALCAQILVWSMASFTGLRYNEVSKAETPKLIVAGSSDRQKQLLASTGTILPADVQAAIDPAPIFVKSNFDHMFRDITSLSLAVGSLAIVVLILLMVLGTIMMTSSVMPGVTHVISASIWASILTVLALPASAALQMPWRSSGLRTYDALIGDLESAMASGDSMSFYLGSLAVPLVCLACILVVGTRFATGVRISLPAIEPYLDPAIEAEASNVKAGSLHGSATSGALNRLVVAQKERELKEGVAAQMDAPDSSAAADMPSEMPRRVI